MLKAFFFDRDGVIIKNFGYVHKKKNVKWLKGALSSIKYLTKNKVKIFIITNQSGIARGYFDISHLEMFHNYLKKEIKKSGGKITEIFYSPYHPKGKIKKFRKKSNLRKPGNGMLLRALKKYNLKPDECFMIGDSFVDKVASKKTNIKFSFKKKISLIKQVKKIYAEF